MSKLQIIVDSIAGAVGSAIGFLYGQTTNGLLLALLVFMGADYISGVIAAAVAKKLSSRVGFVGLGKKFLILVFVALAHIIDTYVLGGSAAAMTAVTLFYIANEGLSIIENAANLGLPVPERFKELMEKIHNDSEEHKDD